MEEIVIGVVVVLLTWYVTKQATRKPIETAGKTVLKFHVIWAVMAFVFMGFSLLLLVYSFVILDPADAETAALVFMVVIAILVSAFGIWLYLYYQNHKVIYDEHGIVVYNHKGRETTFRREDIHQVKYNGLRSSFYIVLHNHKKVAVHEYLTGAREFARTLGWAENGERP